MGENTVTVIHSQVYGELRPEEHQIYQFQQGIVGFSHLHQFALLPYEDTQLFILQAFEEEFSLILLPATMSGNVNGFHIDESVVSGLGIENANEVVAFYILRFIDDEPYVNLKAPILVVPTKQKGCQYVLTDDTVSVRERLILAVGEQNAST